MVLVVATSVSVSSLAGADRTSGSGSPVFGWGPAHAVPGTVHLNIGGDFEDLETGPTAVVTGVSCPGTDSCVVTGTYTVAGDVELPFIEDESGGHWRPAFEVRGLTALLGGIYFLDGYLSVVTTSISCGSPGNCAVVGYASGGYTTTTSATIPFISDEVQGRWEPAVAVEGLTTLVPRGGGQLEAVSCPSSGYCTAAGATIAKAGAAQPFVESEVAGTWRPAQRIPGAIALNRGGSGNVLTLDCRTTGTCEGGGYYKDASHHFQALIVNEIGGTWHATSLPGLSTRNTGGNARVLSVSCGPGDECVAGGVYQSAAAGREGFVANGVDGDWAYHLLAHAPQLGSGTVKSIDTVSCRSNQTCVAGGSYFNGSATQAITASESGGTWGPASAIPGTVALNVSKRANAAALACAGTSECRVVGSIATPAGAEAFVADELNGRWHYATQAPGSGGLNSAGAATLSTIACAPRGPCVAGGYYTTLHTGCELCLPSPPDPQQAMIDVEAAAPGAPVDVVVHVLNATVVRVTWRPALQGIHATHFVVTAWRGWKTGLPSCVSTGGRCDVAHLRPGVPERFVVVAVSRAGGSSEPTVSGLVTP